MLHAFFDFVDGIGDGAVVFAEELANGWQAHRQEAAAEIHRYLAWQKHVFLAAGAHHLFSGQAVVFADLGDDDVLGQVFFVSHLVFDGAFSQFQCDRLIGDAGRADDGLQRAFQGTDVDGDVVDDVFDDAVVNDGVFHFCFLLQDGDTGFDVWHLDVGEHAAFKTGDEAFFKIRNLAWQFIGCDDDLAVVVAQFFEGMEEFFLGPFFTGQELDIIDKQYIHVAIFAAEGRRRVLVRIDGCDVFVDEVFAGGELDLCFRLCLQNLEGDGVEQVCFAKAGVSINKERVDACCS